MAGRIEITKNGVSPAPANPLDATTATYTPDAANDLFMNSGDVIRLHMRDTPAGFLVAVNDQTTGARGSMTASVANGFGPIDYQPTATTCAETPCAFDQRLRRCP